MWAGCRTGQQRQCCDSLTELISYDGHHHDYYALCFAVFWVSETGFEYRFLPNLFIGFSNDRLIFPPLGHRHAYIGGVDERSTILLHGRQ